MAGSPYVNFYTSDFLGGTSGMTAACKGVYITLICLIYETEAPLPQSWETLARRSGCTLPAFKKAMEALVDDGKLEVTESGIWCQKCEKHLTLRRERANSASASAKKRWQKTTQKQGEDDAKAMQSQCDRNANQNQNHKPPIVPQGDFDAFWQAVPKKVGKGAAKKAYAKALQKADAQTLLDRITAYAQTRHGQDPQFTVHPATWLNQERWADEDVPQPALPNRSQQGDRTARLEYFRKVAGQ